MSSSTEASTSTAPIHARKNLVTPLVEQVYPTPAFFFARSAGATSNDVVPLCLHCLMVEAGCTPLASKNKRPPSNWNEHPDEWIVEYRHERAIVDEGLGTATTTTFRLHCSLQRRSGRLFVHAEELEEGDQGKQGISVDDGTERNIQVLGLQLSNYANEGMEGNAWSDYVKNERTLKEMFRQFIVKPLLETSGRRALEGLREEGRGKELYREDAVRGDGTVEAATGKEEAPTAAEPAEADGTQYVTDGSPSEEPKPELLKPELFSPEPGYSYSTCCESWYGPSLLGVAAAIGVVCAVGWWALRSRKV